MKLLLQAIKKLLFGLISFGLLLFVPAGTFAYKHAWLLIGLLFIPCLLTGTYLFFKNPELLKKRLNSKEKQEEQISVMILSALMFLAAFIVAGLNYRYAWLSLPRLVIVLASTIFELAYLLFVEVLRENAYLSRTVEVQDNQKVVDTGLYGIIRHPMYTATIFLFLSMGLILNSPISFIILLFYVPIIVKRIKNEEEVLSADLNGYLEYKQKVKYRLIPYIW